MASLLEEYWKQVFARAAAEGSRVSPDIGFIPGAGPIRGFGTPPISPATSSRGGGILQSLGTRADVGAKTGQAKFQEMMKNLSQFGPSLGIGPIPKPTPATPIGARGAAPVTIEPYDWPSGLEQAMIPPAQMMLPGEDQPTQIGNKIQENVQKEILEKDTTLTPEIREDIGDFLVGFRRSYNERLNEPYHPARAGIRGAFHDVAEGLAGMREQKTARELLNLKKQSEVAKAAADAARAQAALQNAAAAQTHAKVAVEDLARKGKEFGIKLSEDRRNAYLSIVQENLKHIAQIAAFTLETPDPAAVKANIISTLNALQDAEVQKLLKTSEGQAAIDEIVENFTSGIDKTVKQGQSGVRSYESVRSAGSEK